jgi:hypothetical protein
MMAERKEKRRGGGKYEKTRSEWRKEMKGMEKREEENL